MTASLTIHRLQTDTERYPIFGLVDEAKRGIYYAFDGRSFRSSWEPLAITAGDGSDEETELADFALLGTIPMVSERAAEALREATEGSCELLPLVFPRQTYFALNVMTVVDALDEDHSRLKRFSHGGVMSIEDYVFLPQRLEGVLVFRIPQLLRAFVFVTQGFVDRVRAARLTGFRFKQLWRSGPTGSP